MFAFGIITAPRPDGSLYINNSLRTYLQQWDVRPIVFAEPNVSSFGYQSWIDRVDNPITLGIVENWLNALEYLLERTREPWIGIFEDDIEWQYGSAEAVRSFIFNMNFPENVGMVSPYCSLYNATKMGKEVAKLGWTQARMPAPEALCGALTVIMPRPRAEFILNNRDYFMKITLINNEVTPTHLDSAIGATLLKGNFSLWVHQPTLVLHRGEISTSTRLNRFSKIPIPHRLPAL